MIKKPPETYRAFLDRLEDLFDQSPPENVKEAEEELRDAGLDPEVVGQRMRAIAEQALTRARANWWTKVAVERRHVLDKLTQFAAHIPEARSGIETAIREILKQSPRLSDLPMVTAHFRNFAEATDEDLKSLLLELEFLRMEAAEDSEDEDK